MATKRSLYQPASKSVVSDKRTRKPLVQGRLVTDGPPFNTREPHLVQGQLLGCDESMDDPTIQPAKLLPMLTENMSPRPERHHSLDLSDTDIDVMDFSHINRPKPVMVFDASHLSDSPQDAGVDVVVAYENSPARVICHTPGKLERSFRAVQSLAHSGGDCPDWSVKVDRVQNFNESLSRSEQRSQNLLLGDKESLKKMEEARNRSRESPGHYISHQSRGIIQEILVQELGNSNMEAISLHSDTSPLSPQQPTNSGQFSETSEHQFKGFSSFSGGQSEKASSGHSQSKQKKKNVRLSNKSSSFPQPKFEDESDASTDLVPVKDLQEQQPGLHTENSDFETCSLHEYVTPKKSQNKQDGSEKKVAVSEKKVQDKELEVTLSLKKKKMRKIPSRYLLGSANKSSNQTMLSSKNVTLQPVSQSKPNMRSQTNAPPAGKQSREKQVLEGRSHVRSKKPAVGKCSRNTNALPIKTADAQPHQPIMVPALQSFPSRLDSPQEAARPSTFPNNEQKTSTPTHDQMCHLSQDIDASAIHSVSAMSVNMSVACDPQNVPTNKKGSDSNLKLITSEKPSNKRSTNRPTTQVDPSGPSQLQLDLHYAKYLQWAFLNSKAKKMFQEQEKSALSQIHALWQLVESKREENAQLKLDVARLKRINLLDCILDKTEADLESLMPLLPQLEEDYSRLSSALDTTRHQLPTKDIYIPQGSKDEQDLHEEKLETSLIESEQLLAELSALTSDKMLPLSQYLDGVEAINKNVTATYTELRDSQKEVATLKGLTTRLTSLCVQDMQVQ